MTLLRLPELGRDPGRGFRLPRRLLALAVGLGAATLYGATLTLPPSGFRGGPVVGTVETALRVRLVGDAADPTAWTAGSEVRLRWRAEDGEWTEGRGRVVEGSTHGQRGATRFVEWVSDPSGTTPHARPPAGTRVEMELLAAEAAASDAWWRRMLARLPGRGP